MKLISQLSFIFLLSAGVCRADAPQPLLERYPHQEMFQLSSGQKVYLPAQLTSYDVFYLVGTASLSALNAMLAPEDLVADEAAPGSGLGTVIINFVDNRSGDAVSCHE